MPTDGAFGILEEDGKVLLIANWRQLDERVLCWDLPGGGVEDGESLEEACAREFLEETGIPVRVGDLAFMIERFGFRCDDPTRRTRYYFFDVSRLGAGTGPQDEKIVDIGFRAWDELAALCTQTYHAELHAWVRGGRRQRYFLNR